MEFGGPTTRRGHGDSHPDFLQRTLSDAVRWIAEVRHCRAIALPRIRSPAPELWRQTLEFELRAQLPDAVARAQERTLGLLGVWPRGYEASREVVELLPARTKGAYLTSRREIVVRRDVRQTEMFAVVLHEAVHAFQDQRFSLGERLEYRVHQGDRVAALHALAEGEALWVERRVSDRLRAPSEYALDEAEGFDAEPAPPEMPGFVRRSLLAPYRDGYRFVRYVLQRGGADWLDAVWRRGLASTAELLHPERWLDSELSGLDGAQRTQEPMVSPSSFRGDGDILFEDSLGEQGLRTTLEESESEMESGELASAWEGDDYWLVRVRQDLRALWRVRLREGVDASRLAAALGRSLTNQPVTVGECTDKCGVTLGLMARGRDIVVVASSPADTSNARAGKPACGPLLAWATEATAARR